MTDSRSTPLRDAVLAYDAAIRACANDPEKMASHCTAEGGDLDTLYAAMLAAAHAPVSETLGGYTRQQVHAAIARALAEAGIKNDVHLGMCIVAGLETLPEDK